MCARVCRTLHEFRIDGGGTTALRHLVLYYLKRAQVEICVAAIIVLCQQYYYYYTHMVRIKFSRLVGFATAFTYCNRNHVVWCRAHLCSSLEARLQKKKTPKPNCPLDETTDVVEWKTWLCYSSSSSYYLVLLESTL